MKKNIIAILLLSIAVVGSAQQLLTPETLWQLGRVGFQKLSPDGNTLYYSVATPSMTENKNKVTYYEMQLSSGTVKEINSVPVDGSTVKDENLENAKISSNGKYLLYTQEVKLEKIKGDEKYPELSKSNVHIYDNLNQRHWDTWEDGSYGHVFVGMNTNGTVSNAKDIMPNEKFDCPQKPHGGEEDVLFSADNNYVVYVTKKKHGVDYATSTNTDIYAYNLSTEQTENLTDGMEGYDTNPTFSADGNWMAWQSMARDGFEADKNDLWIMNWKTKEKRNLTAGWDETVAGYRWDEKSSTIYFVAAYHGTEQLFELTWTQTPQPKIRQVTQGQFDVNGIAAQHDETLYVTRTDMNHAAEIYSVNLNSGQMQAVTHVNDKAYQQIKMCTVRERYTTLDNGDQLFSWVIYPPNFDSTKKYPVLLYCQGGPQSALTQFYSFRWNFQLMASNGYIVIAPNRTGMPGWGTAWNADISKDWGGNPMRDYLAAIDDISEENYVDKARRGAVGASYGGYSVFMLAGIHEGRFKTFISHCGLFDLRSWYGTTEELWFANWDIGGAYWDKNNRVAKRGYQEFSPSNFVQNWTSPMLIIQGGKDFRVPIEQGLQAFQAAQLKGLKSRFILLPEENHWVLKPQNGMVWQREFYTWLRETL